MVGSGTAARGSAGPSSWETVGGDRGNGGRERGWCVLCTSQHRPVARRGVLGLSAQASPGQVVLPCSHGRHVCCWGAGAVR